VNILYLSCHAILEHDELSIFHELGHNVFSLGGSYQNPSMPGDPKRPALPQIPFNQNLSDIALQCTKDSIHPKLLEWADVIIDMHRLDWLKNNWVDIGRHKVIPIWRTIGQSTEHWEKMSRPLRNEGLKIVRYSPKEKNIPFFSGEDALIRFGVDVNEFAPWEGGTNKVHVFGQNFPGRDKFMRLDLIEKITDGFPRVMYGPDNDSISWSAGALSYDELKQTYKTADVALYAGTIPASYTLSFIEMLVTGTPLICLGRELFDEGEFFLGQDTYEVPDIIDGTNGFVGGTVKELRGAIGELLKSQNKRAEISDKARRVGLELFNRRNTMLAWDNFLNMIH
jgi:hypothetical protein